MNLAVALTLGCLGAVAILVLAEARGWMSVRRTTKPIASFCFVLVPIACGAEGQTATWILAGLALGAFGDLALLGHTRRALGTGLALFLAGHAFYIVAFSRGAQLTVLAVAGGLGALAVAVFAGRMVWPTAGSLRPAVVAYLLTIATMVFAALATGNPLIIVGGSLFFVSDLAVARQRFVAKSFANKAWGLPSYYGAQLLIAWSVCV